jgi:hypothetical protein
MTWMLPVRAWALGAPGETPYSGQTNPLVAETAAKASVTIALALTGAGAEERAALSLRGRRTRPGNSGPFKVSAQVSRLLCPGEYTLTMAQEDDLNGNSVSYIALVRLLQPQKDPPGSRCGVSPPRLPGHVGVRLRGPEGWIFNLEGDRQGPGPFAGMLIFKVFPGCADYRLETELDLSIWRRNFAFEFRVLEFSGSFQGRPIHPQRC